MAYVQSINIKAYPVVNRNTAVSGDTYSRHTSEATLTGIINKLINSDGFVITQKTDIDQDKEFAFNIHGYYFSVAKLANIIDIVVPSDRTSSGFWTGVVYACINLEENGQWVELKNQDETNFTGNDGEPSVESYYYKSVNFTSNLEEAQGYDYYIDLFQLVKNRIAASEEEKVLLPPENIYTIAWTEEAAAYELCVNNASYLKFYGNSFRVDGGNLDN